MEAVTVDLKLKDRASIQRSTPGSEPEKLGRVDSSTQILLDNKKLKKKDTKHSV